MAENEDIGSIQEHHFTNKIVKIFLNSNLSLILILLASILGFAALWLTPREEDPQIVVPLAEALSAVQRSPRSASASARTSAWR